MAAVDSEYFEVEELEGHIVVARMTVTTIRHPPQAEVFSKDLAELLEKYKRTRIVVNLRGVNYFGSSAFAALFGLGRRLMDAHGKLAVCELTKDLAVGANILGLKTVATICETEDEAIAAV